MESGGSGSRRRQFDDRMESSNLQDFLRVKEDDDRRNSLAGLTLSAVLGKEKRPTPAQVNRTLLDIIRDDPTGGFKDSKITWKIFRDKLRLRRAGAAWTSAVPIPASDVPIPNRNRGISRRSSTRFPTTSAANSDDPGTESARPDLNSLPGSRGMMMRRNSSRLPSLATSRYGRGTDELAPSTQVEGNAGETAHRPRVRFQLGDEDEQDEAEESERETEDQTEEGGEQQPVRTSLMALLAETDREMGLDGSSYLMDDDDDEEDEKEEEEKERRGGEYNTCCVCMVRHKGAAFIPCGHTFCRLCSRELWVQRGNCPLCNGFILEILDIF